MTPEHDTLTLEESCCLHHIQKGEREIKEELLGSNTRQLS